jgi:hypothetical protein
MKWGRRNERAEGGRRVLIELKSGNAPERGRKEQLARYLEQLQGSEVSVIMTHPDDDHRWGFDRLFLHGDSAQIRPHDANGYDIDIVVFPGGDRIVRAPHHGRRAEEVTIPRAGELILSYICRADRLEAVSGDLEGNFRKRAKRSGIAAARRWYWWQVVRSAGAFGIKLLQTAELVNELLRKLGR